MRRSRRTKKGITIAEVCVVLAVLAVVSTIVLSFILLVNRRVEVGKAKTALMEDVALTKALIEPYFEKNQEGFDADQEFFNSADKTLTVDGKTAKLSQVRNITCTCKKEENNGDYLLFVTLTYELPYEDGEKTYTFCVNPYVGETVGGGA